MTEPSHAVSILIPCHNAAPYLATALRSAIRAADELSPRACEILVWDDGSSDDSRAVAERFAGRVRVLGDGINRGGNHAREALRRHASGDLHQYLDADDALLPGKLTRQWRIATDTAADVVYACPISVTDDDPRWKKSGELRAASGEEKVYESHSSPLASSNSPLAALSSDVWVDFLRWGSFQTSSILFRAATIDAVGGWKTDQPRCQEHELLLRILCGGGTAVFDDQPGVLYRVVDGSSVSRRDPSATIAMRMALTDRAEAHLKLVHALTPPRRMALATARLESARQLHRWDPRAAQTLFSRVGRGAAWTAAPSPALPWHYRLVAAMGGYRMAETVAQLRRPATGPVSGPPVPGSPVSGS